jgi:hypothetical protein
LEYAFKFALFEKIEGFARNLEDELILLFHIPNLACVLNYDNTGVIFPPLFALAIIF